MSDVKIACGKFGELLPQPPGAVSKVARTLQPREINYSSRKLLVGVDDHTVCFQDRVFTHAQFLQEQASCPIYTLTKREADILLNSGLLQSMVTTFEGRYPWVSDIRFINNSRKNLSHLLKVQGKYGQHLETSGEMANKALKRVMGKVKWKSELDRYFFAAQTHAYQDVFKFTEGRPNRTIFAFDFNSMYGACLEGEFPDPKNLTFREFGVEANSLGKFQCGIYKCTLSVPKNSFIRRFHALKYNTSGQKFGFVFGDNVSAEVLLHKEEVEFYKDHFESLIVEWGIMSETSIAHPLLKTANQAYAERRNYRAQGNHSLAKKCKFTIATLYSCVAQSRRISTSFSSLRELVNYLGVEHQVVKPSDMSDVQFVNYISRLSAFDIRFDKEFILSSPDVSHCANIYSLYSPVIAKGRIKVLRCFEHVLAFEGAEICYSNVDSVHVSIPENSQLEFLNHMEPYLSENIGDLKLEATAKKAVWFEPGRYWLFSDNGVVKYRNLGIRNMWNPSPFSMAKRHLAKQKQFGYLTPKSYYITFMRSLSYRRKLVPSSQNTSLLFNRFDVEEIQYAHSWMSSVEIETKRSATVKKDVFYEMQGW